jgi:hypothetical protein
MIGAIMAVMGPEAYQEGTVDAQAFGRIDDALAVLESSLTEL